jgi:hypothetical protein
MRVLMTLGSVIAALALLAFGAAPVQARTLLFVGNSFTFGAYSPVMPYHADRVTDLNGEGIGGVPALFEAFAREAGLDWQVALETSPGKGLDWHWANRRDRLDKAWDAVVLQSFSTLDAAHPGDPTLLIRYVEQFAGLFRARNGQVKLYLDATWSRPDQTYPAGTPWHGRPIEAMAQDLERGYEAAAKATPGVVGVAPVGLAFNRAIATGLAAPNPYEAIPPGQIDLWAVDHYHASTFGYYLEALVLFGQITGQDPRSLGAAETAAADLGVTPAQAEALQQVAHDALAAR